MAINQSASPQPRFADRLETLLQTIAHKLSGRPKGAIAAFGIFFAVALVLTLVAAVSCLLPAWQASRLDPMRALRVE